MPYGEPLIGQRYIICEECGKKYKKLTSAHLVKIHGLSIPEYKVKWGLAISQPLEAYYIKRLRQEYVKEYESDKNLDPISYQFKKGKRPVKKRVIFEQERIRLEKIAVNVQHTKKFREIISEASKKVWKRKGYKKRYIKNYKAKLKTDGIEYKERMKKQAKDYWSKPDSHKEASKIRKKIWNTEEKKLYASKRSKKFWRNVHKGLLPMPRRGKLMSKKYE